jgi:hypothetical protein
MPAAQPFDPSSLIQITGGYSDAPQPSLEDLNKILGQSIQAMQQQPQQSVSSSRSQQAPDPGGKQPATIRYNNPGGMWDGPSATKFGSTRHGVLSDGNHIAYFDTPEAGAAAQLDLLSSPKYVGQMIGPLIDKWSGSTGGRGNVSQYATNVAQSIGRTPADPLTAEILRGPEGIILAKAQAKWETGHDYPMSDDQWRAAQKMAFPDLAQR